jgi:hypothetical protein
MIGLAIGVGIDHAPDPPSEHPLGQISPGIVWHVACSFGSVVFDFDVNPAGWAAARMRRTWRVVTKMPPRAIP